MFEQRLCLACNDPLPISKRLGAQYCSRDCKHAADATAKRLARFQSHNLRSRELAVATTTYKLWLLGFQREVVERAPRFARGYQLGAPIRGGNLFWFPSSSGAKGRKRRRTLTLSWAKAVEANKPVIKILATNSMATFNTNRLTVRVVIRQSPINNKI